MKRVYVKEELHGDYSYEIVTRDIKEDDTEVIVMAADASCESNGYRLATIDDLNYDLCSGAGGVIEGLLMLQDGVYTYDCVDIEGYLEYSYIQLDSFDEE